jgi:hypothetical protein
MNDLIDRWLRLIALALLLFKGQAAQPAEVVLDKAWHHLGTPEEPEWREFARDRAEGRSLKLRFRALDNPREATLRFRQRDVKLDWNVSLNGRSIGRLYLMEADLEHVLTLPSHALRDGENVLEIGPLLQPYHGAVATARKSAAVGCCRASAKDFHEIRAVFTRGVA